MKLLELQKVKYGTMTDQEKKMNRKDLHSYKTNDIDHLEALIPGIHNLNTVGTSPLKRGAKQILGSTPRINTTEMVNGDQEVKNSTVNISNFGNRTSFLGHS